MDSKFYFVPGGNDVPLLKSPTFSALGKSRGAARTPGQQEGGGPGGGAFTAWEGGRGNVPHAPGPS